MKKKYINEINFKECHKCRFLYKNPTLYFHKDNSQLYGLIKVCKICHKEISKKRTEEKLYHNIPVYCITCKKRFFSSKGKLNRGKKRNTNDGRYCSIKCVPSIIPKKGESWNGRRKGENNPRAKLNNNKVIIIKNLLKKGTDRRFLSEIFKVSKSTINSISAGINWKHIE